MTTPAAVQELYRRVNLRTERSEVTASFNGGLGCRGRRVPLP